MSRPELSVVIPAYNESARLPGTLRSIAAWLDARAEPIEIIVVDDGSTDETSAVVRGVERRDPRFKLIRLARNRGKGNAVRVGVVNSNGRRVLFNDADGATPIEEISRLERALDEGADIAIGSRAKKSAATHVTTKWHRRVLGRAFHQLVRLLTVRGVVDTQCGFKLFEADVAQDLFSRMRMDGFSFDVELLLMAQRRGYRVAEVPVNWTHQHGSRISVVRDGLRMAADLFTIRANALRGLYDEPHIRVAETHAAGAPS